MRSPGDASSERCLRDSGLQTAMEGTGGERGAVINSFCQRPATQRHARHTGEVRDAIPTAQRVFRIRSRRRRSDLPRSWSRCRKFKIFGL